MRAFSLVRLERYDEGIAELDAIARDDPEGVVGLTAFASSKLFGASDVEAARALEGCRRALGLDPGHVDASITLARWLLARRRPTEALAEIDAVRDRAADDARLYLYEGQVHRALGDPERALAAFDRGVTLTEPRPFVKILVYRKQLLLSMGRREAARRDLDRILELAPGHLTSLIERGILSHQESRHDEARADWRRARGLSPVRFDEVVAQIRDPGLRAAIARAVQD